MKTSILIKVLLTVIFLKAWSLSFGKDRISEMPNLIILLADDLGYGELGCQGNDEIPTPHIDGMPKRVSVLLRAMLLHPTAAPPGPA